MSLNKTPLRRGCFLPMNALSVHPQGYSHFCLTSTLPSSKDLKVLNQSRQEVHDALLADQWPSSCTRCLNKENKNLESRRLRTWSRKERSYGTDEAEDMVTKANAPVIRHLDISFSNACNLSCAICSSEFSTGWIRHDKQAVAEGLEFRNFTSAYPKKASLSDDLFAQVMSQLENIDVIIIKGGEPTLEPRCLEFLKAFAQMKRTGTSVFIQSNGTTRPEKWLEGLDDLELEVGISMDGWGEVFNFARGPYFEQVLENIKELNSRPNIRSLTIDFTLSIFNILHLPEFLNRILELKALAPKIKFCPVFQWVQQPYGNPLTVPLEIRLEILSRAEKILHHEKDFFLDSQFLINLLQRPRASQADIDIAQRWFAYMKKVRGYSLGPTEGPLELALAMK